MKAFVGARIFTGTEWLKDGALIIEENRIVKVLRRKRLPKNAEIINVKGKFITPGLVDAHSHIGMVEEGAGRDYADLNESTNPTTPDIRAIDGFYPDDPAIRETRASGITTVYITPGSSNPIAGLGAVVKLKDGYLKDMILKDRAGLKLSFGENPKATYGVNGKKPITRMAIAAIIREAFYKARVYCNKRRGKERDPQQEALCLALRRKIPIRAHAHRKDDILTALRIAEEFNLSIIIEHCTEGHLAVEEMKGYKNIIGCVSGPLLYFPWKVELKNLSFKNPAILSEHGFLVAIMSDHPFTHAKYLTLYAAMAHKEGMDEIEALKAITINPAILLGVDKKVGSLEPGKDADFVIWSHHPFELQSEAMEVYIEGKRIK